MIDVHDETAKPRGGSSRALRFAGLVAIGVGLASLMPMLDGALTRGSPPRASSARAASSKAEPPAAGATQRVAIDPALRPLPGLWRLAPPPAMADVALPLSHLLIAHRGADAAFGGSADERAWLSRLAPRASRTREEALAQAERLRAEIEADPAAFEALARRASDDFASRDLGGRLGTLAAASLHPIVLDAVAELRPGQVSALIETSYGFHLWKLRPAPARELVSGQRVVIPYRGAGAAETAADALTRDQALAVARELSSEARERPGALLELARARAPHVDPMRTGELGTWSTHDIGSDRSGAERELDVLAQLAVDAITAPIDGPHGFQVLRRTAASPTEVLAYQGILLRFDPNAPDGSEHGRGRAVSLARSVLDELKDDPLRFGELQEQYCCTATVQWTSGLVAPELAAALRPLAIGEISLQPIEGASYLTIARRVAPGPSAQHEAKAFELPRPRAPDLGFLVEQSDGPGLARVTRELGRSVQASLSLPADESARLARLFVQLADAFESSAPGPERHALLERALSSARQALGPARFAQLMQSMNEWVASRMLGRPVLSRAASASSR